MMKKLLLALALLVLLADLLAAARFRWQVEKDVTYKVTSYVRELRYLNSQYHSTIDIRNKALLTAVAVNSNKTSALYKGEFQYYEREAGATNQPFNLKEVYPTEFWRDTQGRYTIDDKFYMPVVRDVPVFPDRDIAPGEMWRADGHEMHDLKSYGVTKAYRIPINARYIYVGDRIVNGRKAALFSITYVFNHYGNIDLSGYIRKANAVLGRYRNDPQQYQILKTQYEDELSRMQKAPQRISGSCIQLYYWDIEAGLPLTMSEDFHFIFHLLNNEVHEFKGVSEASFERVTPTRDNDRDRIADALRRGAKPDDGVTVRKDRRGIVVELGDVLFDNDRYNLKPETRARILDLAKRINQAGRFEIRVEGHTDNSGQADYNLDLSQKRAREVAGFLTKSLGTDPRSISWIGHGMTRPAASNASADGRARNRRVEIILLTNE